MPGGAEFGKSKEAKVEAMQKGIKYTAEAVDPAVEVVDTEALSQMLLTTLRNPLVSAIPLSLQVSLFNLSPLAMCQGAILMC